VPLSFNCIHLLFQAIRNYLYNWIPVILGFSFPAQPWREAEGATQAWLGTSIHPLVATQVAGIIPKRGISDTAR
jgi:hypothetical protein